ncbi:MAG: cysteine desulfurase family protein [Acidimicrobiales bacterium]
MPIAYLDHAATTPMRPEAVDALLPFLSERFGNPSGAHAHGRDARRAVDDARDEVGAALGCEPGEVVFTSGGTEADNTAVRTGASRRTVCSAVEHHAVLEPALAAGGVTIGVGGDGVIDLDELAEALDDDVGLVSVMLVNNEVGTIQPLSDVAKVVRDLAPRAVLHTDAVQALPWLDVRADAADADLVSLSAHKIGGPKGVGALVVRDGTPFVPLLRGGGQERERRAGTQPVGLIVAFAVALTATVEERDAAVVRIGALRDRLVDGLLTGIDGCIATGARAGTVAGIAHVCIPGVDAEALLFLLEQGGVLASAGASCSSGALEASHVLDAMGVAPRLAKGSLRLSLGHASTAADVDRALEVVAPAVERLRRHGGG